MIGRLIRRSLADRPGRSALLLVGYALGVGVTVALLSIATALLEESRDRDLVGGGDLTVIPAGLDLETFRTGGVGSLYLNIEAAPFLYRQVLAGRRFAGRIAAAAPWIDDELIYLETAPGADAAGDLLPVSAGGRIPSSSAALGVRPDLVAGTWEDGASDERWRSPGDSALYAAIDAFHLPGPEAAGDSTWAEWHYFNVFLPAEPAWLYLTYLVAGEVPEGRRGGRLLATLVEEDSTRQFRAEAPAGRVAFSLTRPDLRIGDGRVRLTAAGEYRLEAAIPAAPGDSGAGELAAGAAGSDERPATTDDTLRLDLTVTARSRRYLPPLEISPGRFRSGYTAPILDGRAEGRICRSASGGGCRRVRDARAYHDHNWGVWEDVTWDWGQAHLENHSLLYGGVRRGGGADAERFLFLADTLGFAGLLPIDSIRYRGAWGDSAPGAILIRSVRAADSLTVRIRIDHARSGRRDPDVDRPTSDDRFHQMQGRATLRGRLRGEGIRDSGPGFFETWTPDEVAAPPEDSARGPWKPAREPDG